MLSSAVFLCLLGSSLHVVVHAFSPQGWCEPISIPQCKSLPYNRTRFPNAFNHLNQGFARREFQKYDALIRANCSKHLLFFLCTKSAPICLEGKHPQLPHPVPPCRSVCRKIKRDCMPVIRLRGGKWPRDHDCSLLPESTNSMCISPESFVDDASESCAEKCKRREPMNFKKYKKSKFDFVLRAKLKQVTVSSDGIKTLKIKVLRTIFKSNRRDFPDPKLKKISRILVNTTCNCVQGVVNKVYLVAARYRDMAANRMVLSNRGWMEEWKRGTLCQIDVWQRRKGNQ